MPLSAPTPRHGPWGPWARLWRGPSAAAKGSARRVSARPPPWLEPRTAGCRPSVWTQWPVWGGICPDSPTTVLRSCYRHSTGEVIVAWRQQPIPSWPGATRGKKAEGASMSSARFIPRDMTHGRRQRGLAPSPVYTACRGPCRAPRPDASCPALAGRCSCPAWHAVLWLGGRSGHPQACARGCLSFTRTPRPRAAVG